MATIAIHNDDLNYMPELLDSFGYSVGGLISELDNFKKKCSKVNQSVCNLEDAINLISSSTQIQNEKCDSLSGIYSNIEDFAMEVRDIDSRVAEKINESKDDFYEEYSYLKPRSEKNWLEKAGDDLDSFFDWCAENWDAICTFVEAIAAIVAIVAVCVATFGVAAVVMAAAVGIVVDIVSKLATDLVVLALTGEWTSSFESYIGTFFGGLVGGILALTGNPVLASSVDSYISTLFGESLESLTGTEKRSGFEIKMDALIDMGTSAITSKIFGDLTEKIGDKLSKQFAKLSRLSGDNSFGKAFEEGLEKLVNKDMSAFSFDTFRDGVTDGLFGGLLQIFSDCSGLSDFMKPQTMDLSGIGAAAQPISALNMLPFRAYQAYQ